jgi:hypothetical protein
MGVEMIIGIAGAARAGKSTAAAVLVSRFGFTEFSFADKLKKICAEVYDFSYDQLYGAAKETPDERYPREHTWNESNHGCICCGVDWPNSPDVSSPLWQCYLTPRYALQTLGTEWGRHCYPNTWVALAMRHADQLATDVVVPDVRFQSEFDAIKAQGGIVWKIERPGLAPLPGNHASEAGLNLLFDALLFNNQSLGEFRYTVGIAFQKLQRDLAK